MNKKGGWNILHNLSNSHVICVNVSVNRMVWYGEWYGLEYNEKKSDGG